MTTLQSSAAKRVSCQFDTRWDFAYEPTQRDLEVLYATAKSNQWDAASAIDWTRPIAGEGPIVNARVTFVGTAAFERLTPEEQKELEVRLSAWRLSQFLHGEQGALLVAAQLVASLPDLDAKLYASTQALDEGRHVEVFERYTKRLHRIYPVDPVLKSVLDEILASEFWELKLLGMQMIVEGVAIAAFNQMRHQTGDPTLAQILEYVLQDEGRHVNFGYYALRRSFLAMDRERREHLEDFAFSACARLYTRDEHTGFPSIATVWNEMGWDGLDIWRETLTKSDAVRSFNRSLFTQVLIPRLQRLGIIPPRLEPRYEELGLIERHDLG